ncbi:hypothetical protein [Longispora albida]|uniref:hypothetical protein n=1 Tax=Longispora albida TaxID=203523 RepID=UPI00036EA74E|nr:hypothetical protein [Longispora albida]
MSDDPTTPEPTTPADPVPATGTPPWERDGTTFDPARAWSLIEGLRADLAKAKTPPAPAAPAPAPAAAPIGSAEVAELRAELARERVARRYQLDDDLAALLGSGSADEIEARAKLLSERLGAAAPSAPPVARRPVEQVRAGSDPTSPPDETDPAKLAAMVQARMPF